MQFLLLHWTDGVHLIRLFVEIAEIPLFAGASSTPNSETSTQVIVEFKLIKIVSLLITELLHGVLFAGAIAAFDPEWW